MHLIKPERHIILCRTKLQVITWLHRTESSPIRIKHHKYGFIDRFSENMKITWRAIQMDLYSQLCHVESSSPLKQNSFGIPKTVDRVQCVLSEGTGLNPAEFPSRDE
ncbi:uncharacterized protein LOC135161101 [Diachasmimorpha longicaudata]|uniref:uncharacterized protein LOC135161101 n=1 Tax=Diachasmimorpha longicaudata TaxID=58733 RepID=UPI0030B8F9BC